MSIVRRLQTALTALIAVTITWMAYDNVLSDVAPTQALAEAAACHVKDCKLRHGLTKMSRSPIGQDFEFTWQDAIIGVSCRREYFAAGAMRCETH